MRGLLMDELFRLVVDDVPASIYIKKYTYINVMNALVAIRVKVKKCKQTLLFITMHY